MRTYSRDIEDLDAKCMEKFFQEKIESKEISKNQANRELNKLKLAYGLAKWKFHGTFRDTNERYFNHLRKVAEIILNSAEHPTFDQVIVAILHDIVEDTNISIPTIAKLF
jgi:(p)ppGpp synthase/HD superfamily hydrolase